MYRVVSEEEARERPYPYVYVRSDGKARELRGTERDYLEESFHPADGARPYVKHRFMQRDGWGDLSGFCRRDALPNGVRIFSAGTPDPPSKGTARMR